MLILSRLPPDYDSGYIMLLEFGIAFPLKKFWTIYFSGLRWHAGTFPTAPEGATSVKIDAFRLAIIGYPAFASFDFGKKLSYFAALPKKGGEGQAEEADDNEGDEDIEGNEWEDVEEIAEDEEEMEMVEMETLGRRTRGRKGKAKGRTREKKDKRDLGILRIGKEMSGTQ